MFSEVLLFVGFVEDVALFLFWGLFWNGNVCVCVDFPCGKGTHFVIRFSNVIT